MPDFSMPSHRARLSGEHVSSRLGPSTFPADHLFRKLGNQPCGIIAKLLRAKRIGRVGPERRADHRPARRQRPPRPPDVQRRDMPMPNRLLPPRMGGDSGDGQIDFDQAFGVGHEVRGGKENGEKEDGRKRSRNRYRLFFIFFSLIFFSTPS